ncbi:MAG: SgcJ/EcaC family oxidoreductase [Pseudomonadota bacterium]
MRHTIIIGLTASALFLTGCAREPAKPGTAAIEKQLRDNEAKWNAAYAAHDAQALGGAYADDAALANPGAPLVTGRGAILKETAAFAADPNMKVVFGADRIGVAASGDLAYTRGHYALAMTDPGTKKVANSVGNYLTVWKKQDDGSWKAIEDFITPGPNPAVPAAK